MKVNSSQSTAEPLLVRFARYFAIKEHGGQTYGPGLPYYVHLDSVARTVAEFWPELGDAESGGFDGLPRHAADEYWYAVSRQFPGYSRDFQDLRIITQAAAWLHDIVEDTPVKLKEIEEQFGSLVAALVEAVTNEPGANRKIRHALTYPKTRAMPLAVYLKLCDRISNVRAGGALRQMYRKEHEDFRRALYTPGLFEPMWAELDRLLATEN